MRDFTIALIIIISASANGALANNPADTLPLVNSYEIEVQACFPSSAFERDEFTYTFITPRTSMQSGRPYVPNGTIKEQKFLRFSNRVQRRGMSYILITTANQPALAWKVKAPHIRRETDWTTWLPPWKQFEGESVDFALLVNSGLNGVQPIDYAPMIRYRIRISSGIYDQSPPPACPKPEYAR